MKPFEKIFKLFGIGLLMSLSIGTSMTLAQENKQQALPTVEQVNVITPHKIELKGKDLELKEKVLKIVGARGAIYEAKFNPKENVFELIKDELAIGVPYTLRADFATIPQKYEAVSIPCVLETKLVSPNQLEVVFDTAVDLESATNPANYWVRTTKNKATGIATLAADEQVTNTNALKTSQATIKTKDTSNKIIVITFKDQAIPKEQYSLIPCFISKAGSSGYRGGNFINSSRLDFKFQ